ncbi:hypothetical protein PsYK624_082390 [Phanerochaete sordida]|uniref:Fungal-type protein kinase domain-containing protein n=1 Tax=Phanerochaete sordida TaxID=48140 RepID=A0A9P3GC83_9APHY|nr:hypothetical protein PsYK624_082390 [Phanerochaete sordida]
MDSIPDHIFGHRDRFLNYLPQNKDAKKESANSMQGHNGGTMPYDEFKREYLSLVAIPKDLPEVDWTPLVDSVERTEGQPEHVKERTLQKAWTHCILDAMRSERLEIRDSSDMKHSPTDSRPDIDVHVLDWGKESEQWKDPEAVIRAAADFLRTIALGDYKAANTAMPFIPAAEAGAAGFIDSEGEQATLTRGQITLYANRRFARQHLRHQYIFLIAGIHIVICRYDHSGAIVTEAINFTKDSRPLVEFFWAMVHMTDEQRGADGTVTLASDAEKDLLKTELEKYAKDGTRKPPSYTKFDDNLPCYKALVCDDNDTEKNRHVIITSFPIYAEQSTPGRGTRGYIGYDLKDQRLVFLKDSWAPTHEALMSESAAAARLAEFGVPGILPLTCGGVVKSELYPDGQETDTPSFIRKFQNEPWSSASSIFMRTLRHCRYIYPIACPVQCAQSSREIIWVFHDISVSVKEAYEKANVLHQDIHRENIMILPGKTPDERAKGLLGDWDHCSSTTYKAKSGDIILRTCKWQMMPMRLLQIGQYKPAARRLEDDLETIFWALVDVGLHFCRHSDPCILAGKDNLFDQMDSDIHEGQRLVTGGRKKMQLLVKKQLTKAQFKSPAFQTVLSVLEEKYAILNRAGLAIMPTADQYMQVWQELSSPDFFIKLFKDAASNDAGWIEDDVVSGVFVPMSERATDLQMTRAGANTHNPSSLGKAATTSTAVAAQLNAPTIKKSRAVTVMRWSDSERAKRKAVAEDEPDVEGNPPPKKAKKAKRRRDEVPRAENKENV